VDSVRVLLECGADPNAQNRLMGSTPLHMVAQSHKAKLDDALAVVDLLVAHGADVNLPDRGGTLPANSVGLDGDPSKRPLAEKLQPQKPPLVEAIATANVSRVQELLDSESSAASVNQLYTGKTAALFALDRLIDRAQDATSSGTAGGGDADGEKDAACQDVTSLLSILELLVGKGGQLSAAGGKSSPAESLEDSPPVPRLLEELRIAYKHLDSSAPLDGASHWAEPVAHALEGAIVLLVETLKVPVTQECTDCLHQACRRNERRMARFMVERLTVDPNTRGRQGMTPLQVRTRANLE
jgi:Ankyrin repeat